MGAPAGAPTSTPAWRRRSPVMGWVRGPNREVIGPSAGQTGSLPVPAVVTPGARAAGTAAASSSRRSGSTRATRQRAQQAERVDVATVAAGAPVEVAAPGRDAAEHVAGRDRLPLGDREVVEDPVGRRQPPAVVDRHPPRPGHAPGEGDRPGQWGPARPPPAPPGGRPRCPAPNALSGGSNGRTTSPATGLTTAAASTSATPHRPIHVVHVVMDQKLVKPPTDRRAPCGQPGGHPRTACTCPTSNAGIDAWLVTSSNVPLSPPTLQVTVQCCTTVTSTTPTSV